jgi:hypothetical protein
MDIWLITVLIIATVIFVLMIIENATIGRCPYTGGKCFDGNGKYQYKGRGCSDEDVSTLLSRIDWLAKNSSNKPLYTSSYIIAYALSLGVLLLLYASSCYTMDGWEYILILISSFVIVFSITNLINFHTDRYPIFYIRNNIDYIADKLNLKIKDPGRPCKDTYVPHRTKVRDKLNS